MKKSQIRLAKTLLFLGLVYVGVLGFSFTSGEEPKTALIYRGPGACEECSVAWANIADSSGLKVQFVSPGELSTSVLRGASVWIQPGGVAYEMAEALTESQKTILKNFISGGMGYLGVCAGAFLAGDFLDEESKITGLNLLRGAVSEVFPQEATVLPIRWGNKTRHVYFEGGAFFEDLFGPMDVMAHYRDGRVAVLSTDYGVGRVVLSGVHPEAPQSWSEGLSDSDGLDWAYARELVLAAIRK